MNSLDFLQELNEIDDDLLMNAEIRPPKRHHIRQLGKRIAVIAAVVSLMAVMVGAVTISVRILTSDEIAQYREISNLWGYFSHDSKVTTIEYELKPQTPTLPEEWSQALTYSWESFGYDHTHFTGADITDESGSRVNYGGIAELEALLNVDLTNSAKIDEAAMGAYVTLSITDHERAEKQYRDNGIVTPDGLVIYLPFARIAGTSLDPIEVGYCGLTIYLPLTESFAEQYASHAILSSIYKTDLSQKSLTTTAGIEIVYLENTPADDYATAEGVHCGYAAWEMDGVGYLAEIQCNRGYDAAPGSILLPYLSDLEE